MTATSFVSLQRALASKKTILTSFGQTGVMVPMRHSMIFRSRWMALLWSAVIVWAALSLTGEDQPKDLTGASISDEDARNFAKL